MPNYELNAVMTTVARTSFISPCLLPHGQSHPFADSMCTFSSGCILRRSRLSLIGRRRCQRWRMTGAMDASFDGGIPVFPRINVRDPYKRLGISPEASEEEIRAAHVYLLNEYAGHERSRASIEDAYDKIIMESLRSRRRPKVNIAQSLKKKFSELPPWVRNIFNIFDVPSLKVILIRGAFFGALALWSVLGPPEGGPSLQVALSLVGCIYFTSQRVKVIWKAFLYGFIGLVVGWVFGSCVVPFLPPIFSGPWSLELTTALMSYVFLWFMCTFLKN